MPGNRWLLIAAVFGLLAVALGAFGAHGLEKAVRNWGLSEAEQAHRLHNWEVGVRYQMYHALALLAIGILAAQQPSAALRGAGIAFTLGILIFSGCLYAYVGSGFKWLGMIVPIGGVALLAGWLLLAVAAIQRPSS
jgi:uncharacterized membrane protein YgdD (TMEM256/DUF423 family)